MGTMILHNVLLWIAQIQPIHRQDVYQKPKNPCAVAVFAVLVAIGSGCASNAAKDTAKPDEQGQQLSAAENSDVEIEPTVVSYTEYKDPLIGLNRAVFAFNDVSYRYALIPLSKGYIKVVPDPVKKGIGNFFYNLKTPIYLVNNTLQLKPKLAATNVVRFGINSTFGLLGLFDPAKNWFDMERAESHLNDTLIHYGAGYGFYLVLPFSGPSDLRSGVSTLGDYFLTPTVYLLDSPERTAVQAFDGFQDFAPQAERYERVRDEADDPYIFFRNFYLQRIMRDAEYD